MAITSFACSLRGIYRGGSATRRGWAGNMGGYMTDTRCSTGVRIERRRSVVIGGQRFLRVSIFSQSVEFVLVIRGVYGVLEIDGVGRLQRFGNPG